MNFVKAAKAVSGFIDPPAGRRWNSSNISQRRRSFASSQLELTPSGEDSAEPRSCLPLLLCVIFSFPFAPLVDRWGPEEEAVGESKLVFGGTPGTWKNRNQRDDLGGASEPTYRL